MKTIQQQPDGVSASLAAGRLRVLHLEDSPADAELIHSVMNEDGLLFEVTRVPNRSAYEALLGQADFDLILCDHGLPGYDGFTALQFARDRHPATPVIMISGSLDDAQAVESLKNGATDYVLKQRLARLGPAIRRALREAEHRSQRAAAEERVREQADLLNLTGDAIVVRSLNDRITFWNAGAANVFGWTEQEAIGREFAALTHGDPAAFETALKHLRQTGEWLGELQLRGKAGDEIIVFSRWNLLKGKDGQPRAILSANSDITEKKRLEASFLRAQRMDSIGALAGGIAHDLNNALAPVLMSADLLKMCDDSESRTKFLEIIATGAQRATGMVKQILGFARGSGGQTGPLLMSHLIREMAKIVRETFPKSVSVSINTARDLWQVSGDATGMHQVLLNLCVNARDAMPKGGQILLNAANVRLDKNAAAALRLRPGPYVLLTVADTGTGIPPEVLPRIFEPFFTTKTPEVGTGLGLSTVASIVKHHQGAVDIKTEAGKGTEFRIYLPAIEVPIEDAGTPDSAALPTGHGELILVMDDEEAVRELTKATLENYGYTVLTAQNGVQGLACFEENKDRIRLVVSDTDMPVMDGQTAIRAMKQIRPDLPVIIASGAKGSDTDTATPRLISLGKPYNLEQLLVAVAKAITA